MVQIFGGICHRNIPKIEFPIIKNIFVIVVLWRIKAKGLSIQLIRSGREGIGRLGIKFMAHEPRLAPSSSPSYNRLTSYNVNYTFPTRLKTNHFLQSTVISVIIKQIPYKMCETSTNADFPVQELFAFFSSKV